jgi:predicted transcriptional regulator
MAHIVKFKSKKDLLDDMQAAEVRNVLSKLKGLPENAVGRIVAAIDQNTAATTKGWSFIMLSPKQNAAIVKWLKENSARSNEAVVLWAECFTAVRADTGEIMLTRLELAERVGMTEQDVSRVMSELVSIGAISRKRERVPGLRGPGLVRYFMNPTVATHLPNKAREKAQADAPPLLAYIDEHRSRDHHRTRD